MSIVPRPHNPAVRDLRAERIRRPARRIGRDDVHVAFEEDGLAPRPAALEPREHDRAAGPRFIARDGNSLALQDVDQEVGRLRDVARRVRRVEADVVLERLDRVALDRLPVRLLRRKRDGGEKRDRENYNKVSAHEGDDSTPCRP
jgi:hypothetical protein